MKNLLIILIVLFAAGCTNKKEQANKIIEQIYLYEETNNRFPSNLNEMNNTDGFCYYLTNQNFNLEYTSFNDLYWYNSGNDVWDFLEGDADKYYCQENK